MTDCNAILDKARERGETYTTLTWGDTEYPFHRTPDSKGWDTEYQLPASLWGELQTANINGGGTR